MKRFQGGLVFEAHRRLYHSTLGSRLMKKRRRRQDSVWPGNLRATLLCDGRVVGPRCSLLPPRVRLVLSAQHKKMLTHLCASGFALHHPFSVKLRFGVSFPPLSAKRFVLVFHTRNILSNTSIISIRRVIGLHRPLLPPGVCLVLSAVSGLGIT